MEIIYLLKLPTLLVAYTNTHITRVWKVRAHHDYSYIVHVNIVYIVLYRAIYAIYATVYSYTEYVDSNTLE